jgi:hypothetical protein
MRASPSTWIERADEPPTARTSANPSSGDLMLTSLSEAARLALEAVRKVYEYLPPNKPLRHVKP